MAQLIVTAYKLNKRNSVPPNLPEPLGIVGVVNKGFTFQGEEVAANETPNAALGKWFKDRDNNFYWGGGVTIIQDASLSLFANTGNNYFDLLQISSIWNALGSGNLGKNIKVAILDSGIDPQTAQLLNVKEQMRFYCDESAKRCFSDNNSDDSDYNFHGTHCASLIGASVANGYYCGIAPDCEMYIYRIKDDYFFNPSKLQIPFALNYILDNNIDIDIISMSFQFTAQVEGLEDALNKCVARGILLFAAAGDTFNDDPQYQLNYPAYYRSCFEIAACDSNLTNIIPASCYNNNLSFIGPGVNVPVLANKQQKVTEDNSSVATAFTSGVVALLLSYFRTIEPDKKKSANRVIKALTNSGKNYTIPLTNNQNKTVQIIQPYNAFLDLKS